MHLNPIMTTRTLIALVTIVIIVDSFGSAELQNRNIRMPLNNLYQPLNMILKRYDPVYFEDGSDDTYRTARHARDLSSVNTLQVRLSSMNRTFHLSMYPHKTLFDSEFEVIGINAKGGENFIGFDKDAFMEGHLVENNGKDKEPESRVVMHVDEYGILSGHIYSQNELFVVEPAKRHIRDMIQFPMIMYRWSDINHDYMNKNSSHDEHNFCGNTENPKVIKDISDKFTQKARKNNFWRRADDGDPPISLNINNTCRVSLVADYQFFSNLGQNSPSITVNFIVSALMRVNDIYAMNFDKRPRKLYLSIHRVLYYSDKDPKNNPYAADMNIADLLHKFKRTNWERSCLAHLFTHRDFAQGKLGLAVIGSSSAKYNGGICAKYRKTKSGHQSGNVGLTTTLNNGGTLITQIIDTTIAHEIAHNFGSAHDPVDDPVCSPTVKYIMYPSSSNFNSLGANSFKFSPCSLNAIEEVMAAKGDCLTPKLDTFCGNLQLENSTVFHHLSEQCDVGFNNENDLCCNDECKLKEGKLCSPANYVCCGDDCQAANTAKECSKRDPLTCSAVTYCSGSSFNCPPSPPVEDGVVCRDQGICEKGMCNSFCFFFNAEPCTCPGNECSVCCQSKSGGSQVFSKKCQLPADVNIPPDAEFLSLFRHLPRPFRPLVTNATPCTGGLCHNGACVKSSTNDMELNKFEQAIAELGSWMKDFLVPTILLFSVLALVPYFLVIRYRNLNAERKERIKSRMRSSISETAEYVQHNFRNLRRTSESSVMDQMA